MERQRFVKDLAAEILKEGGVGSGNFGHKGRPGKKGGSLPGKGDASGVEAVMRRIKYRPGGFSYRPWGKQLPRDGFMVSRKGGGMVFTGKLAEQEARAWIRKNWNTVHSKPNRYFGGWTDKATKKIYLDISEKIPTRGRALALGKIRNQLEIWDVVGKAGIKTGYKEPAQAGG